MRGLIALVFVFLAVGVGWYVVSNQDPELKVGVPDGGTPKAGSGESSPPDELATTKDDKPNESSPVGKETVSNQPAAKGGEKKAAKSAFATRYELSDDVAKQVQAWHQELATTQGQFENELDDGGSGAALMKEFNQVMSKHRATLRGLVGADRANRVLGELPVYEFDNSGSWHRVDAEGKSILFTDAKNEDRWQNFKRRQF